MAKLTLNDAGNLNAAGLTTINANNDLIEAAIENTLSRDGTSPNQMSADIDLNNNDLLNVGETHTDSLYIDGVQAVPGDGTLVDVSSIFNAISIDEDDMASNIDTKVPTQQSVKAYVDGLVSSPASLTALAALTAAQVSVGTSITVLDTPGNYKVLAGNAASNGYTSDGVVVVENSAGDITFVQNAWRDRREINLLWYKPVSDGTSDNATKLQQWLTRATALAVDKARPAIAVCPPGVPYLSATQLSVGSNVHVCGGGAIRPHSNLPLASALLVNDNNPSGGVRAESNIQVYNLDFDGSNRSYPVWLTHVAPHPNAGTPVTDPQNDYSTPGTIDTVQYPGGTIADVVAAGRRNAAATSTAGYILSFTGVDGLVIRNCRFSNHGRFTVVAAGCLNHKIIDNEFEACGAIDISSNAILDGHYGSARWITAISKANPAVISLDAAPSFATGEQFQIFDVLGMSQITNGTYTAGTISGLDVPLSGVNSSAYNTFAFNGRAYTATVGFVPSQNAVIARNRFTSLKRAAIQHTGFGGRITDNVVKGSKEGGLFFVRSLDTVVERNEINDVAIADLVANCIELNDASHIVIRNNTMRRSYGRFISGIGAWNADIENNRGWRASHNGATLRPYGPFSERYNYSSPPQVAGIAMPADDRSPFVLHAFGLFGVTGRFCNNTAEDDRTTPYTDHALILTASGTGSAGQVKNLMVQDNDFDTFPLATVADLIAYDASAVDAQTVRVRGNKKHPSQSAFFQQDYAAPAATTGNVDIVCGFPPSAIEVLVLPASGVATLPLGMGFSSLHKTQAAQSGSAASEYEMGWSGSGASTNNRASALGALVNAAGSLQWACTFVQWNADGFRLNVTIATQAARLKIKCYP